MGTGRWRHEALVQARGHCRGKAAYEYGGNTRWFDDSRVSRWIVNACCWRHLLLPSLQLIFTSGACMLHVPPALMLMAPAAARVSAPALVMATPEGVIVTEVPPMVICIRVAAIIWICIASTTQPTGESWMVWYGPVGMGGDGIGTGEVGPFWIVTVGGTSVNTI